MTALLEARGVVKHFSVREGLATSVSLRAVDGVSFRLEERMTLGIVGESGCGKSTLARLLLGLIQPTAGDVLFKGTSVFSGTREERRRMRRHLQIVFQDPFSSLNPWMTAGEIIERPLIINRLGESDLRRRRVEELLERVGLPKGSASRLPHEFSGGQRQRIAVARALATNPDVIVADEPTSALDVSVQATILNLMKDLQDDFGLSYVFISHDMRVIKHMCDEVAVMYLGEIVEQASTHALFAAPRHPYTLALLDAVPQLTPSGERLRPSVEGDPPSALDPPEACRFHPRCPYARERCRTDKPELRAIEPDHTASCHFAEAIAAPSGQGEGRGRIAYP